MSSRNLLLDHMICKKILETNGTVDDILHLKEECGFNIIDINNSLQRLIDHRVITILDNKIVFI